VSAAWPARTVRAGRLLDGTQQATGRVPVDVQALDCDVYLGSGQKSLLAGRIMFMARASVEEFLWPGKRNVRRHNADTISVLADAMAEIGLRSRCHPAGAPLGYCRMIPPVPRLSGHSGRMAAGRGTSDQTGPVSSHRSVFASRTVLPGPSNSLRRFGNTGNPYPCGRTSLSKSLPRYTLEHLSPCRQPLSSGRRSTTE